MQQKADLYVEGLDCAEEVLLLKRQLSGVEGVGEANFDVLNARMIVPFDPNLTSVETIIRDVAETGMRASLWEARARREPESWWNNHSRALMTTVSGVLLVAGFVTHASFAVSITAALGHGQTVGTESFPLPAKLVYTASIIAGIWLVAPKAWMSLSRLRPDMNLLMSVAVAGAMIINEWFEAATITVLFSLALLLESWSMGRARRAISALMNLAPPTARRLNAQTGETEELPIEEVEVGSVIVVRPGEKIPLDGQILKGSTSINEAPITGESVPAAKQPGDDVFAGTINEDGAVEIEVTRPANDTTLARIVQMVQEAQSRRAPSEQWIETFARYYTPAMMLLALLIAVIPPLFLSGEWLDWTYRGLVVLVIACPCALVISTPVSIVTGLTSAARHGVLVKGGRFLEAAAHLQAVALDKTGTLTYGRSVVQKIVACNGHTTEEVLQRAAAMEAHSQHPLARAILKRADEEGVQVIEADSHRILSGRGAEGVFDGRPFWIGSHRLMHEQESETPEIHRRAVELEDAGHSVVAVGNAEHVCGLISLADDIRPDVADTIAALKRAGIRCTSMLTGDNEKTARDVAAQTGIDEFRFELLPEDKVREVESLRKRYGQVAMVGDGVNDAPAMAASTLGIAMGAIGSDTAIETADVALMSDDLSKLPWLIAHARRTLGIIRQNIGFALGVKLLFVVLTLAGAASLWMAIAADTGASLLVIFNGLRLLRT